MATTATWDASRATVALVNDGTTWPTGARCDVLRLDPQSQAYVPVRGGTGITTGYLSLTDLEADHDTTVTYHVDVTAGATVTTETVQVKTPLIPDRIYLKDVVSGRSASVFVREVTTVDRPTIGGMLRPPYGKARSHRAGVDGWRVSLTIGADTPESARALAGVLEAGAALIQQRSDLGFPDGYYFFEAQPHTMRIPEPGTGWWDWDLELQDDAMPAGDFAINASGFTYDMLTETGLTYDELAARGASYFDWTLGRY